MEQFLVALEIKQFLTPLLDFLLEKIWEVAFVLLAVFLTWFCLRILRNFIYRTIRINENHDMQNLTRKQRYLMTFVKVFFNIIQYLVWFIIFIQILAVVGIQTNSLITILGATGLTIGIIIRDIFIDIMNGFLILTEDQFRVGDYVTINNFSGYVQEIGIRTTKIVSTKGDNIVIANRNITNVITYPEDSWKNTIELEISLNILEVFEQEIDTILAEVLVDEQEITALKYDGVHQIYNEYVICRIQVTAGFNDQWRIRKMILNAVKPHILTLKKVENKKGENNGEA
ncbi:MAG: mechanosensitive ion channel family protein [Culicoidibacterales bacterium]